MFAWKDKNEPKEAGDGPFLKNYKLVRWSKWVLYHWSQSGEDNAFVLLYSTFGKTLAMFGGNINFENVFKETTSLSTEVGKIESL